MTPNESALLDKVTQVFKDCGSRYVFEPAGPATLLAVKKAFYEATQRLSDDVLSPDDFQVELVDGNKAVVTFTGETAIRIRDLGILDNDTLPTN